MPDHQFQPHDPQDWDQNRPLSPTTTDLLRQADQTAGSVRQQQQPVTPTLSFADRMRQATEFASAGQVAASEASQALSDELSGRVGEWWNDPSVQAWATPFVDNPSRLFGALISGVNPVGGDRSSSALDAPLISEALVAKGAHPLVGVMAELLVPDPVGGSWGNALPALAMAIPFGRAVKGNSKAAAALERAVAAPRPASYAEAEGSFKRLLREYEDAGVIQVSRHQGVTGDYTRIAVPGQPDTHLDIIFRPDHVYVSRLSAPVDEGVVNPQLRSLFAINDIADASGVQLRGFASTGASNRIDNFGLRDMYARGFSFEVVSPNNPDLVRNPLPFDRAAREAEAARRVEKGRAAGFAKRGSSGQPPAVTDRPTLGPLDDVAYTMSAPPESARGDVMRFLRDPEGGGWSSGWSDSQQDNFMAFLRSGDQRAVRDLDQIGDMRIAAREAGDHPHRFSPSDDFESALGWRSREFADFDADQLRVLSDLEDDSWWTYRGLLEELYDSESFSDVVTAVSEGLMEHSGRALTADELGVLDRMAVIAAKDFRGVPELPVGGVRGVDALTDAHVALLPSQSRASESGAFLFDDAVDGGLSSELTDPSVSRRDILFSSENMPAVRREPVGVIPLISEGANELLTVVPGVSPEQAGSMIAELEGVTGVDIRSLVESFSDSDGMVEILRRGLVEQGTPNDRVLELLGFMTSLRGSGFF